VEIAEQVRDSGMSVEDLDYLLRHRFDPVGKYLEDHDALELLVKALCTGVRQVLTQQVIPDDATAITNDLIHDKISLVLPADVVDAFMGFWADTKEFETVTDVAAAAQKLDPTVYQVDRIRVVYDAVRKQQRVIHSGVLTLVKQNAILTKVPDPNADAGSTVDQKQAYANFVAMLNTIKAASEQERKKFVNDYLQPFVMLQPDPYAVLYDAAGSPKPTSAKTLLAAILPAVRAKLIREFVTQTIAANVGADPVFIDAMLIDLAKDPTDAAKPLRNAFAEPGTCSGHDRHLVCQAHCLSLKLSRRRTMDFTKRHRDTEKGSSGSLCLSLCLCVSL